MNFYKQYIRDKIFFIKVLSRIEDFYFYHIILKLE